MDNLSDEIKAVLQEMEKVPVNDIQDEIKRLEQMKEVRKKNLKTGQKHKRFTNGKADLS